jgi:hypothetical protein
MRGALLPELIDTLHPSDDQRKRLEREVAHNEEENGVLQKRLAAIRSLEARNKIKRQFYEPARKQILGALTAEQQERLKQNLGPEFRQAFELADQF